MTASVLEIHPTIAGRRSAVGATKKKSYLYPYSYIPTSQVKNTAGVF